MKERPILFSAPMVRAILREVDPKGVTRRIVKPQPPLGLVFAGYIMDSTHSPDVGSFLWAENQSVLISRPHRVRCPYGQPGDRLWVRETFCIETAVETDQKPPHNDGRPVQRNDDPDYPRWKQPHYRATDPAPDLSYEYGGDRKSCRFCEDGEPHAHWKPSIHMPRWASRITLEVTDVLVERLQDITEEQAKAEGAVFMDFGKDRWGNQNPGWTMQPPAESHEHCLGTARYAFANLINKINGPETWDANPWVWAVSFRRIQP